MEYIGVPDGLTSPRSEVVTLPLPMMPVVDGKVVVKAAVYGPGIVVGLFGLGALVVAVIVRDCVRRNW